MALGSNPVICISVDETVLQMPTQLSTHNVTQKLMTNEDDQLVRLIFNT